MFFFSQMQIINGKMTGFLTFFKSLKNKINVSVIGIVTIYKKIQIIGKTVIEIISAKCGTTG